jgi:hypothetical protein
MHARYAHALCKPDMHARYVHTLCMRAMPNKLCHPEGISPPFAKTVPFCHGGFSRETDPFQPMPATPAA